MQPVQRSAQLRLVRHFNNDSGRPEDFLLQHFVAIDQQAGIGLEQLRPGLATLLRMARQMLDSRMIEEFLQAFAITGQRSGIEHGLRRLFGHHVAQKFEKRAELR
ncbi:hypothetical protein D3C76_1652040 [compost metagenome]